VLKNVTKIMLALVMVVVVVLSSTGAAQAFEYGGVECECVPAPRGPLIPPRCGCTPED